MEDEIYPRYEPLSLCIYALLMDDKDIESK